MKKYTIGIDFGTLSARAVLLDVDNGSETASAEFVYPHGVMSETLPCGIALDKDFALQHPQDYIDALSYVLHRVVSDARVSPEQVVGVGIDFTSCTVIPVDADFVPLCFNEKFKNNPHAYAKLWKHHGAAPQSEYITKLAKDSGAEWLAAFGGSVPSEWLLSKILETLEKSTEVYDSAEYFVEAGDWLVWLLTGDTVRSSCMAGFKGLWRDKVGYVDGDFLKKIHPRLGNIYENKLRGEVLPSGTVAGKVSAEGAKLFGLAEGTVVSVPVIDAHAALPAVGVADEGKLMLIIGTSCCHIVMDKNDYDIEGIFGKVGNGLVPGYIVYEAGQACVGDLFDWFIKNCVPTKYADEAKNEGISVFDLLERKASAIGAGENRVFALDWWNGSRTPYNDTTLSGAMFGFTLATKPEEIYRALIEAVAFGTKVIVDLFENGGIKISECYAGGGIAVKNKLLMQIFADVTGKEIKVTDCVQAGAVGSAILAASAAEVCDTMESTVKKLSKPCATVYKPNITNTEKYKNAYERYKKFSELFAKEIKY